MKNNYLVIQGFMVSELNLSGNDLLTYALIYGFSQDGETEFTGSINYLCKWLNCSRPTAIKSLKFLTEKSLIVKSVNTINGVNFNRYKISLWVVKNLNWGSKESLLGGSKETLPNNTTINNTNNNIEERKKNFAHSLKPFLEEYGKNTLNDFYFYWTEHGENDKKMRFEKQTSFNISLRLKNWVRNDKNKNNFKKSNVLFVTPEGIEITDPHVLYTYQQTGKI
jgi:hypothetical protein